jgi:hypothetical protein
MPLIIMITAVLEINAESAAETMETAKTILRGLSWNFLRKISAIRRPRGVVAAPAETTDKANIDTKEDVPVLV